MTKGNNASLVVFSSIFSLISFHFSAHGWYLQFLVTQDMSSSLLWYWDQNIPRESFIKLKQIMIDGVWKKQLSSKLWPFTLKPMDHTVRLVKTKKLLSGSKIKISAPNLQFFSPNFLLIRELSHFLELLKHLSDVIWIIANDSGVIVEFLWECVLQSSCSVDLLYKKLCNVFAQYLSLGVIYFVISRGKVLRRDVIRCNYLIRSYFHTFQAITCFLDIKAISSRPDLDFFYLCI